MVVDIVGAAARRPLPEPVRWLARLHAMWEDQRADLVLPDADELFLADMAELIPHLILAYREESTAGFRVEFAGAAVRDMLALEPVGTIPEDQALAHPLAWLAAGFLRVRRPAAPGPAWVRWEGLLGLFLPYGAFDGRVTMILAGIARWPAAGGDVDQRVVPIRRGTGN